MLPSITQFGLQNASKTSQSSISAPKKQSQMRKLTSKFGFYCYQKQFSVHFYYYINEHQAMHALHFPHITTHEKHIKMKFFSHASLTRSRWELKARNSTWNGSEEKLKQFRKLNFIVEYSFFFGGKCFSI